MSILSILTSIEACADLQLFAGMFDPLKTIGDQRCAPPGQHLGVKIEMDQNRQLKLANNSGDPSNWEELKIMLQGGHRNRVTQPVRPRDTL